MHRINRILQFCDPVHPVHPCQKGFCRLYRMKFLPKKTLLGFGVQTFSLTFSLLFLIGAVFRKEKRWKETKSQTESLDSEPGVERNEESD
jgi:hypothetical protein